MKVSIYPSFIRSVTPPTNVIQLLRARLCVIDIPFPWKDPSTVSFLALFTELNESVKASA